MVLKIPVVLPMPLIRHVTQEERKMDLVVTGVVGVVLGAAAMWAILRASANRVSREANRLQRELREMERRLHETERDHIARANELEREHAESTRGVRDAAFAEGKALGQVEGDSTHRIEVSELKVAHRDALRDEHDAGVAQGRAAAEAELAKRAEFYSVRVSPFVESSSIESMFSKKTLLRAGYQYQLLINGVPAFTPHQICDSSYEVKELDREAIAEAKRFALEAADKALALYAPHAGLASRGEAVLRGGVERVDAAIRHRQGTPASTA